MKTTAKIRIPVSLIAAVLILGACSTAEPSDPLEELSKEPSSAVTTDQAEEPSEDAGLEEPEFDDDGGVSSGNARYGTWLDYDGTTVEHPEGADDLWGEERVSLAVDHTLDAIHAASINNNVLSGDEVEARDFIVMEEYLTPEAYDLIGTELEEGDPTNYVYGIAPYLEPGVGFDDLNGDELFVIDTQEAPVFEAASDPSMTVVSNEDHFGDDEARLVVYLDYDIAYKGEGKSATETREASFHLLPMGDGWGIEGHSHSSGVRQ